jgi:hypothetical protein
LKSKELERVQGSIFQITGCQHSIIGFQILPTLLLFSTDIVLHQRLNTEKKQI